MKESITSGPRKKSLLTTLACSAFALAFAAGPARAQTAADKPVAPAAWRPG